MAKIKSTLTGTALGQCEANSRIHRSESCVGTTRDGTHVYAQTSARPLNDFVESASVRSVVNYDWRSGQYKRKELDIVENGRRNINSLCIRPVTNGRHVPSEEMPSYGMAVAVPSNPKSRKKKR